MREYRDREKARHDGPLCVHGRGPSEECCPQNNDARYYNHRDRPDCFCRPQKTYTDPVTGTEVWVHRYADD